MKNWERATVTHAIAGVLLSSIYESEQWKECLRTLPEEFVGLANLLMASIIIIGVAHAVALNTVLESAGYLTEEDKEAAVQEVIRMLGLQEEL